MNRNNDGVKVLVGVAIGAAIGAAMAYFSDAQKRNEFVDDVNDRTGRVRDDFKDAYYEGKIRARKAKRDLSRYMADVKDDAGQIYDDVVSSAKTFGKKSKESAEEIIELTEEELSELKAEAREEAEKLAKKSK
ncbi:YtxH domain-containing protein [Porphyromonadaceae bacterium W3.11]|nr:YtxH domain-containing protein [Porphyromonadaceae bacterium W3.11]